MRIYIVSFALCFLVITGAVAAVNYGIMLTGSISRRTRTLFALTLPNCGRARTVWSLFLWQWERNVKIELARQSTADCYVWGSSRVMQVDKPTAPQVLGACGAVINLWESGATFEDFVAAAGSLVASGRRGRVFIGVDPWLLRRNVNSLWTQERASYERGRAALGLARDRNGLAGAGAKWLNLVSADYALNNLRAMFTSQRLPAVRQSPRIFDAARWPRKPTPTRRSCCRMAAIGRWPTRLRRRSSAADGNFWIAAKAIDPGVAAEFELAVRTLEQHGLKVTLVLTPYHPDVMACTGARVCQTLTTCGVVRARARFAARR